MNKKALIFDMGGVLVDLDIEDCKRAFKEELGFYRIDEIIEFSSLGKQELMKICSLMMKDMINELSAMGIGFEITDEAKEMIVDKGYTPRYGARPIRRQIQMLIEDKVSSLILEGSAVKGTKITVCCENGEIAVSCTEGK